MADDRYDSEGTDETWRDREVREQMGASFANVARATPFKRRVFELVYHPWTEFGVFALVLLSVGLLVAEIAAEGTHTGWMAAVDAVGGEGFTFTAFFWIDVALTVVFGAEYLLKLWVAPRKWYFVRKNWVDLIAILPILRVFRLGRAVRLLRLLRLLRLARIGVYVQQFLDAIDDRRSSRAVENEVIVAYLAFSLAFGTIGILVFEKGRNESFQTLGDGLWWCVVTITTVGYGDLYPITAGGKVVAGVIMFIGLTFWALVTGTVSSVIIEHAKRNEGDSMVVASLQDHVVICGWNETGERLVRDLRASADDRHVVILQEDPDIQRVTDPLVHYLMHDPTTAEGLHAARVEHARVAVVLADQRSNRAKQDIDARSILTALAIERVNSKVHTIVELLNEENVFHVRNASVDEVIVSGQYLGTMLSQTVQFPGLSDVFQSLFQVGEGVQMREAPLPSDLAGTKFAVATRACNERNLGVLLGFRRGTDLRMSPGPDEQLQAGDRLILMQAVA